VFDKTQMIDEISTRLASNEIMLAIAIAKRDKKELTPEQLSVTKSVSKKIKKMTANQNSLTEDLEKVQNGVPASCIFLPTQRQHLLSERFLARSEMGGYAYVDDRAGMIYHQEKGDEHHALAKVFPP